MKKRSLGVMLVLTVVLVLSVVFAASAFAAAPYITGVDPTSGSNTNYNTYQLKIFGQNFSQILDIDQVTLQQTVWPYDVVYASNPYVVTMLGGDYIACSINTYLESAGTYDVVVDYYTGFGQIVPDEITRAGAFTITGTPPATSPTIASVRPQTAVAGGAAFTLTVNGANFGTSPTVYWNSTALVTTPGGLPNPTATCTAIVPAALIANAGAAQIMVMAGALTSNTVPFVVTAPVPTLTGLNPAQTWAKLISPPAVTLSGTNFQSGNTQVLVNGAVHAATYVSATQMTCQLTAADIANAGTLNFAVRNGASGTPTASLPFTVNAETTIPVVTISGADDLWHNQPVTLTVNASDSQSGIQKVMYLIGSMPFTTLSGTTITVPGPQGGITNGVNSVQVYALDNTGAQSQTAQATVNICTTGPQTEAFAPSSVKKGKSCKISYICNSITPQCSSISIKIYNSNGAVKKSVNGGTKTSNQKYSISFTCNLSPGKYKVKVFATDAAGNAQSAMDTDSFQVTK
jgi:hypothetical protein